MHLVLDIVCAPLFSLAIWEEQAATMAEEDAQQRITFLLQEVDANINAAHRSATQICATMRRHHQILKQIHDATQVWRPLFESFRAQPVARRTSATPARSTYEGLTPPGSSSGSEQGRAHMSNISEEESLDSNLSIVAHEQTFKTTTLRHHFEESVHEETMNMTMTSERLPAMARTSYLPTPAAGRAPDAASTIRSEDRSNWSPAMSSPPRTGMIKVRFVYSSRRYADWLLIHTLIVVDWWPTRWYSASTHPDA